MNVLLLGSGGREHAMAWKIAQSSKLNQLYIAPGNAGTSTVGQNVAINPEDFDAVGQFSLDNKIDMIIVGPEAPLVKGITDHFATNTSLSHIPVIGPSKLGAELEGSKEFAKKFMQRHNIPTAGYKAISKENLTEGIDFLRSLKAPYVLKADGLAGGKGVLILDNLEEAESELKSMLDGKFGNASTTVVIEEFLSGIECSVFVLSDGKNYVVLPEAKDYKRIGEGDTGLNTGGMGAISPVPFADKVFMEKVNKRIIQPTVEGLRKDKITYKGFIFLGLILVDGEPMVIEYNVRMGDPETEAVMLRLDNDFLALLDATAKGELDQHSLTFDKRSAVTIVLVAKGYPEAYEKGKEITCLNNVKDSIIFHAGTYSDNDKILSCGGRILAVSSYGKNKEEALKNSFANAKLIQYEGKNFRSDIGFDL